MPRFKKGDPQLVLIKKDGSKFTKTFHSEAAKSRAWKGWISNGGRIAQSKKYNPKFKARSRGGKRKRKSEEIWAGFGF